MNQQIDNVSKQTPHYIRLTAPEIAALWSQYQSDTMAVCVYKYMLNIVKDASIRPILEFAFKLAESHITKVKDYLSQDEFPIPHGFNEADVNLSAPRLFSDEICLTYTYLMAVNGMALYAGAIATAIRKDVRDYFIQCEDESMELFNQSIDLLLQKGFVSRPPYIYPRKEVEFIESKRFMGSFLGGKRPLSCIEISHVYWDLKKIQLSKAFTMAFAQVAQSKEVSKHLWRGVEIYTKQIEVMESILSQEQLSTPKSEEAEITNSTVAPFSDRLMMYHKTLFGSTTLSLYGTAIGSCQRADLSLHYARFMAELAQYMEDAFSLMIKNKWVEQPPMAEDREALATEQ
ncbi:hypothetical protein GFC29_843 [Anoxybacillus sp. B7M1]|jgi:hypothetical protein|uniref:DUF3231 family protein n=1 Tax=unclassified Anoxybacillus TaxID=2639704 RepID=UPI0005CD20CD|nr:MULTISPECIES: DUF3231 family protein [unclassified Anoxybacillus]ANB57396.1 hypothetical protein GFC28_783 [Anoxybacillus sp. B2M1]ANB65227.1 hypothetical protein GFC29_843 [Anoxybacillus sp. B7M1]